MPRLPRRVMVYLLSVSGAAAILFALALAHLARPSPSVLVTFLVFSVAAAGARLAPLPLARHRKLVVDTTPQVAATLLLPFPLAMAAAALPILGADALGRKRWFETAFHTAEAGLRAAAGAGATLCSCSRRRPSRQG